MVWYFHFFQNFPQFIVIHTVEGFGLVNKVEIDVFLELSCFFNDPADFGNLIFQRLPGDISKFNKCLVSVDNMSSPGLVLRRQR